MSTFNEYTNFNFSVPYRMIIADKLAKTTASIATQNFDWRYITLLFFNSTFLYGVNSFMKLYDKNLMMSSGSAVPRNAEETRQYVIFSVDVQHVSYALDWLQLHGFDNTGRFIIVCELENCNETEAIQTFWYHKITNVVFLRLVEEEVFGFIYFFNGENCAMGTPVKINMAFCLQERTDCKLFPEKFANFYKCPLIASTFRQPPYMMDLESVEPAGSDGRLLVLLAGALNATLKIMTPHRGEGWGAFKNGTWQGSLSDIYYDLANISMTSCALTLNRFSNFQLSFNYHFVTIGWVSNPTELEPASLKLLHPFSMFTHIGVCLSFILVIVCSVLVTTKVWERLNRNIRVTSEKKNSAVFYSWMICMGIPAPKLPKKPILLNLVVLWIWYTFLVRTMYQASLINSLKANVYSSNVHTVQDMIKNNYKFGGGFALRDYFLNDPEAYNAFIGMNFSGIVKLSRRISEGEKFAIAVDLDAASSLYFKNGEPYHILSEKVVVSPTAIFFKKFSPIAKSVNRKLVKLVESGIADRFYKMYVGERKKLSKPSDGKEPMTLEHFTGCYAILFAGWSVSALLFFSETLCDYKNKKYSV